MRLGVTLTRNSFQDQKTETVYELPVNITFLEDNRFIIISKCSVYTTNPQAPNNRLSFLHW
jgi:hypothetical protein